MEPVGALVVKGTVGTNLEDLPADRLHQIYRCAVGWLFCTGQTGVEGNGGGGCSSAAGSQLIAVTPAGQISLKSGSCPPTLVQYLAMFEGKT